ncbi:sialate O-acetylesterase [Segetibacter sp.]|jgi:sialate O-acetylesterase|uniref:sialate O-acetylesterase n=1 Tax=Segetibacter sp. TaxID=2231182 RepID=UPI00262D265C|nr:sialate O-acetylesterase [Segetibacter sp.]MCW3082295.1 sialate O-acetylesterase [Segetibacter sp.]
MKKIGLFFSGLVFVLSGFAEVRLPAVIADNMVLQQQSSVALWGWSNASEKIIVTTSWNNKTDSVVASRDAKWKIMVQTPAAGGPHTVTIKGGKTITLKNVMIGEVWVCSGQSNMEFNSFYEGSQDIKAELKNTPNNNIHFFLQTKATAQYPQDDCKGQWTVCDSNTLKSFSEVAYFFAKRLNKELNVPIGLIEAAWGGTPAEVWTPAEVVNSDDTLRESAHKQAPQRGWPFWPGLTYNAMIAPVTNYNIAGALWYQGEGNTVAPNSYGRLLTSMIKSWRRAWDKEFPFYYVQIGPFTYGSKSGSIIQEQQTRVLAVANTGMVVITDLVPDTTNIHPPLKREVGERLSNWALAKTYHKTGIAYASPLYKSMDVKGNKATISFEYADEGLMVKGPGSAQLYIAGIDKAFYPAELRISGNKLIVWSDKVAVPVAVRFSFSSAAVGNLFSKSGLPVTPFRTDNWGVN